MWLLNARDESLRRFDDGKNPQYAILSHRWLHESEEVTFPDIQSRHRRSYSRKLGYGKIRGCCREALRNDIGWVWIDTCCIDKDNLDEYGAAIRSMFSWYRDANVCYVYLGDVGSSVRTGEMDMSEFEHSAWFQRGWTLQELLAPTELEFFDKEWNFTGSRQELQEHISNATKIHPHFLDNTLPIARASVAERMSWAAYRITTKPEDMAYCLLGIFDVTMHFDYGRDVGDKAFETLQEEIMRKTDDQTLFTWRSWDAHRHGGLLARSPRDFQKSKFTMSGGMLTPIRHELVFNKDLDIVLPVLEDLDYGIMWIVLRCVDKSDKSHVFSVVLPLSILHVRSDTGTAWLVRAPFCNPLCIRDKRLTRGAIPHRKIRILRTFEGSKFFRSSGGGVQVDFSAFQDNNYRLDSVYPPHVVRKRANPAEDWRVVHLYFGQPSRRNMPSISYFCFGINGRDGPFITVAIWIEDGDRDARPRVHLRESQHAFFWRDFSKNEHGEGISPTCQPWKWPLKLEISGLGRISTGIIPPQTNRGEWRIELGLRREQALDIESGALRNRRPRFFRRLLGGSRMNQTAQRSAGQMNRPDDSQARYPYLSNGSRQAPNQVAQSSRPYDADIQSLDLEQDSSEDDTEDSESHESHTSSRNFYKGEGRHSNHMSNDSDDSQSLYAGDTSSDDGRLRRYR